MASADSHSPPNSLNREIIERLGTSFTFPGMMPPHGALSRLLLHHRAEKLVIEVPNDEVGKQIIEHMRTTQEELAKLLAEMAAVGGVEYDWEGANDDGTPEPVKPKRRRISAAVANDDEPKRAPRKKKGVA